MPKKSGWDVVKGLKDSQTTKNRDVYNDQQFERTSIGKTQTMTLRNIFAIIISILVALVVYLGFGFFTYLGAQISGTANNAINTVQKSVQKSSDNKLLMDQNNDLSKSQDATVLIKYYAPKGYYVSTYGGSQLTKCTKDINKVPIRSNWKVTNASTYNFKSKGDGDYNQIATIGQIKKGIVPKKQKSEQNQGQTQGQKTLNSYLLAPSFKKIFAALFCGFLTYAFLYEVFKRNLAAQNATEETADISQYHNDRHIMLPEQMMRIFEPFPDAGAHSRVQPASLISHTALKNKGLKSVDMVQRYKADTFDSQTKQLIAYKGAPMVDQNGNLVKKRLPIIDTDYMESLFTASGDPKDKNVRIYYDANKIPFKAENVGEVGYWKKMGVKTVADVINKDWTIPDYEVQRPGGCYWVDTAPVNTMVLAITRAGKGQTYIEPLIDMWTREKRPNNIVINDPKGELLQKFYVPATYRGFQIVQFNLINAMNTDIYNPLMLAAQAAQEGDFTKCSMYIGNIADVFFPVDGGDDPVWPNAANNAFKRAAFGLIDYYLEKEKDIRREAQAKHTDAAVLNAELDKMWGKVTLYNCYQMFVQLTSKTIDNPLNKYNAQLKSGELDKMLDDKLHAQGLFKEKNPNLYDQTKINMAEKIKADAVAKSVFWDGQPKQDELTLFFNATDKLPSNEMRTLVSNANNALKSMAGAEKMLASVYGIAITAMSFFTDPTISTLTSGTPSQNVDLAGISFPRRIGFRLASEFATAYHLVGQQAVWQAYSKPTFAEEDSLGDDFHHEGLINRTRWAKMYFKGIFPNSVAYLKCVIRNPQTGMHIVTFYFEFHKAHQTSLAGTTYVKDPILDKKIVKNGLLYELRPFKNKKTGQIIFRHASRMFKEKQLIDISDSDAMHTAIVNTPVVTQTMVRYSEKPKMIFLVTPPHLMSYAKIILILIKQLVDLNFDQSYMTKSNQKPLYKTRFMLDELGNLQSDKHGINGFQTMLSIGLGQEQQFTLILQTLQQLKDVYGDSVDKIVQGNTSNIIFLKSTDDTMIETLSKMSGKTHVVRKNSKTVTRNLSKLMMNNEGKISYTLSNQEEAVITYNDLAFISERNSVVFRAGNSPIWNRNQTILPMSWRLLGNTISQPGHEYTFSTIPTLSSAKDFDVRKNQPDFSKMLAHRMKQALFVDEVEKAYRKAYNRNDYDIQKLDPNDYSDEIMTMISVAIDGHKSAAEDPNSATNVDNMVNTAQENKEQQVANQEAMQKRQAASQKIFAQGHIAPSDLVKNGVVQSHQYDTTFTSIYSNYTGDFKRDKIHFVVTSDGSLMSADGQTYYIQAQARSQAAEEAAALEKASQDKKSKTYSDEDHVSVPRSYTVTDDFYKYLASLDSWTDLAEGTFDREVAATY